MNFRPPGEQDIDINLTPLIDVVFLLLIFFMVSTTFIKESEIELTLPQATEDVREELVEKLEISIDHNGTVFVNQRVLSGGQIGTCLLYTSPSPRDRG